MLPSYKQGAAAEWVTAQNWQFKTSGDELVLAVCPYCGKKDKFYINNSTGAFSCKAGGCGQVGNYFTLRRDLGDPVKAQLTQPKLQVAQAKKRVPLSEFKPFEDALLANEAAMKYLASRGINEQSAKDWHLGWKHDKGHDILMIPYITKQGNVADVKYRTLPPAPKQFWRRGGGESILFGEHLLPDGKKEKADTIYLCEGELDAIVLTQNGFSPALSTTTGANSFNPRWYDVIVSSGVRKIVLIYDSDVTGQAAAEKLVKKFNDETREVLNVILEDAKDASEYFQSYKAEDLRELIRQCRPAELEHVVSMTSAIDRLEEQIFLSQGGLNGCPSQFSNINELIDGGYWNGFLVTIVGASGTGKTSFALQEAINIAEKVGAVYFCCLEMPVEMMLRKIINHLYHVPMKDIKPHHLVTYRADLERRNIYLGGGIRNVDKMADVFTKAHKRYDLRAIVFDNINFFVRSADKVHSELAMVTKRMKELAVELGIPIFMIAQPRKFDRAERIINESDVKDSAAIEQDSDILMLMWRPTLRTEIKDFGKSLGQKDNLSPLTLIRIGKARYSPGGETLLYFHGEVGTFRQLAEDEQQRLIAETAGMDADTPAPRRKRP